ncbi:MULTISPECIES: DNA replication/repair protein RecF [Ectothiorhodospira]|uniref:DNA replication and repair protein RecF n=1 Tax=Ectothiorhodospira marina TaxID=1396821 RepID=A0A1H7Q7H0_9GAMM|nr:MULTISPECIES: DNA replication/repair protein RecF [Ectothiorhodospira]MCG5515466.1 DNA replication/repair protein RecF [Ectothiorhodospira sp. 9100]MCG5518161.1 DNA replication/repair protein RecF [Ectothiorhodospira sp. 9905]SEL44040.1 DNA replication and repair protein RecF [Ectothiorhodospira marina]
MSLSRLEIFNLRIFARARLDPVPGLNLIIGPNASGKTSLLEGIHVLATGRSFRTTRIEHVVHRGSRELMVTGQVTYPHSEKIRMGIRKGASGTRGRLAGRTVRSQSELARVLPLQVIHPDSHELLSGPPAERRSFLDWGLFHEKPEYMKILQGYRRALNQRNEALRRDLPNSVLRGWERELAERGESLDNYRRGYLERLWPVFVGLRWQLPDVEGMTWEYRRGWKEGVNLGEALASARDRERSLGYTLMGPHRAELVLRRDGVSLAMQASRGQQKTAVLLLRLSQVAVHRQVTGRSAVVMVDDLPSELDAERREAALDFLSGLECQVFVSAIEAKQVQGLGNWSSQRMFHVEHGSVREA